MSFKAWGTHILYKLHCWGCAWGYASKDWEVVMLAEGHLSGCPGPISALLSWDVAPREKENEVIPATAEEVA